MKLLWGKEMQERMKKNYVNINEDGGEKRIRKGDLYTTFLFLN